MDMANANAVALQQQNQRLYNALAKMYLWQASVVNELMPDELSDEVRALLGEKMVDEIIYSASNATYEQIQEQVQKESAGA